MPRLADDLPVSAELWAAQQRLLALRREHAEQADRQSAAAPPFDPAPPTETAAAPSLLHLDITQLPDHLGWGSNRLAEHLRRAGRTTHRREGANAAEEDGVPTRRRGDVETRREDAPAGSRLKTDNRQRATTSPTTRRPDHPTAELLPPPTPNPQPLAPTIRLYPTLGMALLHEKQTAAGRVWLLLRHIDSDGRGCIDESAARHALTTDDVTLRICGPRQLRNLLERGEGLFWERRDGRVWLRSTAKVAAALGVTRLTGRPVAVRVDKLTGTIGQARAQLYAAFHSGRQTDDLLTGEKRPRGPIARSTLTELSAACPNSQRAYERRAGIRVRRGFAVGPPATSTDQHEQAWRRGRALFLYRDQRGRYGRPGRAYHAWQLPNEYTGPHESLSRGRQKRLNRALGDLLLNGMTGNGERPPRRFYGSAKAAALAGRNSDNERLSAAERYWRGRDGAWHWWPGPETEFLRRNSVSRDRYVNSIDWREPSPQSL